MATGWDVIFSKVQTGTQKEAAENLGISQSYLSRLQRGERKPGLKLRRKLAGKNSEALALFLSEIVPIMAEDWPESPKNSIPGSPESTESGGS